MKTLPDHPCRRNGVLLIGINPAPRSVAVGHYYQGRLGQRLWSRLEKAGLLNRSSAEWEDDAFVAAGNGLTDLVKRPTASATELSKEELRRGTTALARRIREWRPSLLLFAFLPPAKALIGTDVGPGVGPRFQGTPTFRLAAPYAPRVDVDENLSQLERLVSQLRGRRR